LIEGSSSFLSIQDGTFFGLDAATRTILVLLRFARARRRILQWIFCSSAWFNFVLYLESERVRVNFFDFFNANATAQKVTTTTKMSPAVLNSGMPEESDITETVPERSARALPNFDFHMHSSTFPSKAHAFVLLAFTNL